MAPSISLELRPQIENVHQFLRNGETDLSIMPADFIDPEQPHEQLFEDTFSCVVWNGNTAVGESLDLDTFLRSGHAVVRLGQPSVPPWPRATSMPSVSRAAPASRRTISPR